MSARSINFVVVYAVNRDRPGGRHLNTVATTQNSNIPWRQHSVRWEGYPPPRRPEIRLDSGWAVLCLDEKGLITK